MYLKKKRLLNVSLNHEKELKTNQKADKMALKTEVRFFLFLISPARFKYY